MPPPSSENDLKRRARRRLIGAVALTLLAVIVLPLLLEDEPPPASSLVVRMAEAPAPVPEPLVQPSRTDPPEAVDVPAQPALSQPAPQPAAQARPAPEPAKPASPKPASLPEAVKSTPKPQPSQSKPAASSEVFVVQLAALSDAAKAQTLKARAIRAGFPAYSDSLGTLTRVRVGPYMSREAAEVAAEKLAKQGISGGQVLIK